MVAGSRAQVARVEVLGPIRALDADGRDVTPDGALQRRLLALLVLRRGHVVSRRCGDRRAVAVELPRDPAAALQNHLFRLRRACPTASSSSIGDGYRLDPRRRARRRPARRSAGRRRRDGRTRRRRRRSTRSSSAGTARRTRSSPTSTTAGPRRLASTSCACGRVEARAERRLATGDTDGLVAELTALADAEPLRERPRALLMAALAATGRQVEALRVYDDFRRLLGDELGIEPSPALAAQHADLLARHRHAGGRGRRPSRLPVPGDLAGRAGDVARRRAGGERSGAPTGWSRWSARAGSARPGCSSRSATACWPRGRTAPSCCASWPRPTADRPSTSSPRRWRSTPAPASRSPSGSPTCSADTELVLLLDNCEHVLDPVAELVERLLARCPNVRVVATSRERLRVAGEQVCTVPTLPVDRRGRPGRAAVRRAGPGRGARLRARSRASWLRRRDRAPARRAAAGHRAGRGPPAHPTTSPRSPPGSTTASTCCRRATARRPATGRWPPPCRGRSGCSTTTLRADLRRPVGVRRVVHRDDAAAVCGRRGTATAALAQLVERSLVMRAPDRRYVLLETLRAFGAEQLAAADGPTSSPSATPVTRSSGSSAPTAGCSSRVGAVRRRDRRRASRSCAPRSSGCSTTTRSSSPAASSARSLDYGLLRLRPDVLAWAERVTDADPRRPQPVAPRRVGGRGLRRVDGRRRRRDRRPQRPGARGRRAAGGDAAAGGGDDPGQLRAVRGSSRRGRRVVPSGPSSAAVDDRATPDGRRHGGDGARLCGRPVRGRAAAELLAEVADGRRTPTPPTRGTAPARPTWPSTSSGPGPLGAGPGAGRADERLVRDRDRGGVQGVDRRPHRRPRGRRRGLPPAHPPLAPGRDVVDAVDDAALDRRRCWPGSAASTTPPSCRGPCGRPAQATASSAPTRSRWTSSAPGLRATLGDEAYEAARRRGRGARRRRRRRARPPGPCDLRGAASSRGDAQFGAGEEAPARLAPMGCMNPPARTSRHAFASGWAAR